MGPIDGCYEMEGLQDQLYHLLLLMLSPWHLPLHLVLLYLLTLPLTLFDPAYRCHHQTGTCRCLCLLVLEQSICLHQHMQDALAQQLQKWETNRHSAVGCTTLRTACLCSMYVAEARLADG